MYYLIIVVLIFVSYGSLKLSIKDYRKKNICPKVIGIPACYLVFIFFLGALVAHVFDLHTPYVFYGFLALPFLLALMGSLTELSGKEICPRTTGGRPMCYISLGFCSLLMALKFFAI